jgi:hypothetical protein
MSFYAGDRLVCRFGWKLVIYKNWTEMHGQHNLKFCNLFMLVYIWDLFWKVIYLPPPPMYVPYPDGIHY